MPDPQPRKSVWQSLWQRSPDKRRRVLSSAVRLGIFLLFLGLTAIGGLWTWEKVTSLGVFELKHIQLRGAGRLSEAQILQTAQISYGQPLLKLSLTQKASALLAHPWIESVAIRRHLPDRLALEVVEQVPRALVMLDELWIVNLRGQPFKRFEGRDRVALPVLSGFLPLAQKPELLREALLNSLALMDHLSALHPAALDVESLHHDDDLGVSAMMWMHTAELQGPLIAHLGLHPQERTPQLLRALDDLSARGQTPREIWLDGQRKPAQVTFRPALSPLGFQAKKSQSSGQLRTMNPTSVVRSPRPPVTGKQRR